MGILTSNCITVYSLKGNTLGILEKLDIDKFNILRIPKQDPREHWKNNKLILIGSSTYYRSDESKPHLPEYLKQYEDDLLQLEDKDIILFGSGRSEYSLFCGVLDYLHSILKDKNNIKLVYKFEGYPRDRQKDEFKQLLEEIING
ncbi:flavodoxin family protein [Metabacillus sp. Hm71]|uniref:flavodoxin family protein n=1 Tax=Metabacillus sp. Hm71 TaxID=3450743 RepID=UPI003F427621